MDCSPAHELLAYSEDLHLFAGLAGTQDFFELWEENQFSVGSIFDDEDARDSSQHTDFKLMRTGDKLVSLAQELVNRADTTRGLLRNVLLHHLYTEYTPVAWITNTTVFSQPQITHVLVAQGSRL